MKKESRTLEAKIQSIKKKDAQTPDKWNLSYLYSFMIYTLFLKTK